MILAPAIVAALFCADAWAAGNGQLVVNVIDRDTGKPLVCRMHLKTASGKPRKPDKLPYWHDHFVVPGSVTLKLPVGDYVFELERGPEYATRVGHFTINPFADDTKQVDMKRDVDMAAEGWWSGDLFVRRPVGDMQLLMEAEDLHLAEVVTWWNEKNDWGKQSPPQEPLIAFGENRCYQVMAGGVARSGTQLLLFGLKSPQRLPSGAFPDWPRWLAALRDKNDLWVDATAAYWWDLPLLVAAGQLDSVQVANSNICRDTVLGNEGDGKARDKQKYVDPWGNPQWSQYVYFQLLECGLRMPPSAGSGSGFSPNPVGYNRAYVHLDGEFSYAKWFEGLRAGRVCVTNGPLLRPTVYGESPGHVFQVEAGVPVEFEIGLTLSTRDPIDYLEIIKNGRVAQSVRFDEYAASGRLPKLRFDQSGWFLVRAVTNLPKTYCFGLTGPYYVEVGYQRRVSRRAAQFFLDWVYERGRQIKLDDPVQQQAALEAHRAARDFWQELVSKANAE